MRLHTVDPTAGLADRAIRDYLTTVADKPVRYRAPNGTIINTTACRWRTKRYVLIDTTRGGEAVTVSAVRRGFLSLSTLSVVREPAIAAAPSDASPVAVDAFTSILAVYVGMALDDLEHLAAGDA